MVVKIVTATDECVELMDCDNAEEDGNATDETILMPRLTFLFNMEERHTIHPVGHIY